MNLPIEYLTWLDSIDTSNEICFKNGLVIDMYSKEELKTKSTIVSNYFKDNLFTNGNIYDLISQSSV